MVSLSCHDRSRETEGKVHMATSDAIGRERQRVSEQLARRDAESAKLANELNELEITERVLTQFGRTAGTIERRRSGRPARTDPETDEGRTRDDPDARCRFVRHRRLVRFLYSV